MRQERALRFEAARAQQEKIVQAQPDYGPALCVLGLIDAALGRKDAGVGRRPAGDRAYAGGKRCQQWQPRPSIFRHHCSLGGREGACLAATGSWTACSRRIVMLSYGALKLFPFWDPLRGDPRFEKIVASLAPEREIIATPVL